MKRLSIFLLTSFLLISFTNIYADQEAAKRKSYVQTKAQVWRARKTALLKDLLSLLQDLEKEKNPKRKALEHKHFNLYLKDFNQNISEAESMINFALGKTSHPEFRQFAEAVREDMRGLRSLINEISYELNGAEKKIQRKLNEDL